jgi:hypothetical protein
VLRHTTARPVTARVKCLFSHGEPLAACDDRITIPAERIEVGEIVFRVAGAIPDVGLAAGDLLIVEPRANGGAATGEFVIATLGHDAFIGRYWKKHGARSLLDDAFHVIAQGSALRVLGAVTLILRDETH